MSFSSSFTVPHSSLSFASSIPESVAYSLAYSVRTRQVKTARTASYVTDYFLDLQTGLAVQVVDQTLR